MNTLFSNIRHLKAQKGLTMVELMIALVLSSLLILGVIQVFIANKTSYRLQEAQSRLQENARFALTVISSELRKAGHLGCVTSNLNITTSTVLKAPATFRPWTGVEGWEADATAFGEPIRLVNGVYDVATGTAPGTPPQPTAPSPAPSWSTADGATIDALTRSVADSDIIRVWYAGSTFGILSGLGTDTPTVDPLFTSLDVVDGDVFVLNDCAVADFIQACAGNLAPGGPTTTFDPLGCTTPGNNLDPTNTFPATTVRSSGSEIRKLHSTIFFVGKRGNDPANPPALFWRELGSNAAAGNTEELVEGVESIQFMYGEDTDGDNVPNAYVPADKVTDWTQVTSVKVSLLMRSVITSIENNTDTSNNQNITTTNQSINFNGVTITPTDGRLRRVFSTTIALRNKLI